ncbi:MAG: (2Fe-2S)-binding protein, partial [Myxococcales bacterium]|nr:(2Fe-2S)-binding protein [Myxococcales bacterium]
MTQAPEKTDPQKTDLVTLTIDGISVSVPKGTLVIRAAEQVGIQIPRFCDHPLLSPVGACRQCLVEVALPGPDGSMRQMQGPPGRMKPQASCTLVASEGMEVTTEGPDVEKAREAVLEYMLINHPLDCPVGRGDVGEHDALHIIGFVLEQLDPDPPAIEALRALGVEAALDRLATAFAGAPNLPAATRRYAAAV